MSLPQLILIGGFTGCGCAFYTALVTRVKLCHNLRAVFAGAMTLAFLSACCLQPALAQDAAQKESAKPAPKTKEKGLASEKVANPAQIELLETKMRFESNGDSRKEVHTVVKINSEAGARQFARLTFDFNRSFEGVEIPFVRITHASGGTADILPSAISDQPNPAVVNAAAYQDVRVKSVRILGLEPGDALEYRVMRTVTHHPLAPDFWLDHSFDRSGIVTDERFAIDVPADRKVKLQVQPEFPYETIESESRTDARVAYQWKRPPGPWKVAAPDTPDIGLTTFASWDDFSQKLILHFLPRAIPGDDLNSQAKEMVHDSKSEEEQLQALYEFVSQKIRTVDLPLGTLGFYSRHLKDIIASGYANAEEKAFLFSALCEREGITAHPVFVGSPDGARDRLPSPQRFSNVLVRTGRPPHVRWLDPALEVAPLGAVQANFRGRRGFLLVAVPEAVKEPEGMWPAVSKELPFPSRQSVRVESRLGAEGKLTASVYYSMRGDNELLLRVAFHQSPKEKWKELAQLLSLTDGFRGEVSNVTASDPYATREPFTLEYEIAQPKFVDWSKKTVRIPALLPQLGLPDPPGKTATGSAALPIDLGTPLEVDTRVTLRLPPGTTVASPTGTSVERDYATYSSQYTVKASTITASRHIHFILREIPGSRAADYNAFLRAVQSDEAQVFTLEKTGGPPEETQPLRTKTP